jgi:hypothetical protein
VHKYLDKDHTEFDLLKETRLAVIEPEPELETIEPETEVPIPDHWQVFRDLLAFQFKLVLDAGRDLLLSPISVIAVIAGLLSRQDNPGKHFYDLLRIGHKSDHWINLFGTSDSDAEDPLVSSDTYVKKVEDLIINEVQKGGVVKNMKDKTDGLIEKIRKN